MTNPGSTRRGSDSSALWRVSGLGIELTASIGGMLLLGWLIDAWAGTGHRWLLILGLVGLIGGGYNFIRGAVKFQKQAARETAQRARQRRDPATPGGDTPPDLFERSFPEPADADEFRWPDDDDEPEFRLDDDDPRPR